MAHPTSLPTLPTLLSLLKYEGLLQERQDDAKNHLWPGDLMSMTFISGWLGRIVVDTMIIITTVRLSYAKVSGPGPNCC